MKVWLGTTSPHSASHSAYDSPPSSLSLSLFLRVATPDRIRLVFCDSCMHTSQHSLFRCMPQRLDSPTDIHPTPPAGRAAASPLLVAGHHVIEEAQSQVSCKRGQGPDERKGSDGSDRLLLRLCRHAALPRTAGEITRLRISCLLWLLLAPCAVSGPADGPADFPSSVPPPRDPTGSPAATPAPPPSALSLMTWQDRHAYAYKEIMLAHGTALRHPQQPLWHSYG